MAKSAEAAAAASTAVRRSARRRAATVASTGEAARGNVERVAASASLIVTACDVHSATTPTAVAPALVPPKNKFVGVHVSASGGPHRAVGNSLSLGPLARSMALFIRPRLSWKPLPPLSDAAISNFQASLASAQQQIRLEHIAVHGSYLINFGSHDASLREKSVALMVEEVAKCAQLGVPLYVLHPGSCTGDELRQQRKLAKAQSRASSSSSKKKKKTRNAKPRTTEENIETSTNAVEDVDEATVRRQSLAFVAACMVQVLDSTDNVTLVVENMAGQGQVLGSSFQELRAILDGVATLYNQQQPESNDRHQQSIKERIGVCLDTCHAFASGHDLRTTDICEQMMRDFDSCMLPVWPNALKVVHLNDSKTVCGSNVDRHANIGQGTIGMDAFRWIMNCERFENLPLILETPRTKKPKQKQKLTSSMETETESVDMETNNSDLLSSTKRKKRVRETQIVVSLEESGEETIPSATQELALLYSLVVDD